MKYKTKKILCPDCKKKEPNQIIFTQRGIAHLRCPECNSVNLFSVTTIKTEARTAKSETPAVESIGTQSTDSEITDSETTKSETTDAEITDAKDTEDTKAEKAAAKKDKALKAVRSKVEETEKISSLIDHNAVMEKFKKKCAPYAASTDYFAGDYFHHKIFGNGYVLAVLPSQKMTVLFAEQKRLLRCGPNSQKEEIIQFGEKSAQNNEVDNA